MGGCQLETESVRAFFGLPLPAAQRSVLASFIAQCGVMAPQFRWVPVENLHLTLRFVGNVEKRLIESVADRLGAEAHAGFDISLGVLGTFKRGRLTRVVWLGVDEGSEPCEGLAARIDSACRAAGLAGDERPFRPHLTLARARSRDGTEAPQLPALPRIEGWPACEYVLYRSHLGRQGALYESLRTIALKSA
jgi:RNA 2',3'-cyclic 3'-phosphodiesterase